LADRQISDEPKIWPTTLPPTSRERWLALGVVAVLFVAFGVATPFANTPAPRFDSFIPSIGAVILVTDLITSILLFVHFSLVRSRALLVLASGYLFTALIVIPHALTFPGAFAPTGLLGAGVQTTAWLYVFWHIGFPLSLFLYAWLKDLGPPHNVTRGSPAFAICWSVVTVIGLICGIAWVATGDTFLPPLFRDDITHFSPIADLVVGLNVLICALALGLLWTRRRSALDHWLMVVAFALLTELATVGLLSGARFTLGFYAGRVFSLITSTVVLVVFLSETTSLYGRLARSNIMLTSANHRLAAQWARLRRANAFKNELLGTLAHDLRNPLTVIIGRTDMLLRMLDKGPVLGDRLRTQIDQVRAAASRLDEMVDSVLSDARADALDITIRPEETDVSTLVHEVAEANQPLAARKQQSIIVMAPPTCPVLCDGERVRDVIDNLLSNAIKYSQIGGRIDIELERQHENVVIRVKDQGAGLSPEDLSRVFGRFQRLSAKPTANELSTGLGLSIVKRIVDLHGGSVVAESPGLGLGATFTVTLPVQASTPTQKAIDIPAVVMR
jgi:signal transduction histidine kinase